jgi:hypothetical protein
MQVEVIVTRPLMFRGARQEAGKTLLIGDELQAGELIGSTRAQLVNEADRPVIQAAIRRQAEQACARLQR